MLTKALAEIDWPEACPTEQMFANRGFAVFFLRHVHDFFARAGNDFVQIIRRAMEFLRAEDQIHVRQFINQFLSAALRHAAHETKHDIWPVLAHIRREVLHFADGLLLREIAHAARVEQNHVGGTLRWRKRIAFGDELGGDGFAVALVHLAAVGFDENAWHSYFRFAIYDIRFAGGCHPFGDSTFKSARAARNARLQPLDNSVCSHGKLV